MNTVATIEARMTSSRLPGKMAMRLGGDTVLGVLVDRLLDVPELDGIVLATTTNTSDDVLAAIAETKGIKVFRGSENDVLGRVRGALDFAHADVCVEITGDCPLTDPSMVSTMIAEFHGTRGHNAYVANTTGPTLGAPHGLDIQVFEADALRRIDEEHAELDAREHVSVPFYRDSGSSRWRPRFVEFYPESVCHEVWLSLDYQEDYNLICDVHDELAREKKHYGAADMIEAALARADMTRACLALRGW